MGTPLVVAALLLGCASTPPANAPPVPAPPPPTETSPVTPAPDPIAAAIASIDDDADPLHSDMTPAVHALSGMGLPAVGPLLDVLMAPDSMTRLHAQRALEGIVYRRFGFVPGRGFPNARAEDEVRALWAANGGYAWDGSEADRARSVELWRAWLEQEQRR